MQKLVKPAPNLPGWTLDHKHLSCHSLNAILLKRNFAVEAVVKKL